MAKQKRLPQVRVGDQLYEAVVDAADQQEKSVSELVRSILERALLPQHQIEPVNADRRERGGE